MLVNGRRRAATQEQTGGEIIFHNYVPGTELITGLAEIYDPPTGSVWYAKEGRLVPESYGGNEYPTIISEKPMQSMLRGPVCFWNMNRAKKTPDGLIQLSRKIGGNMFLYPDFIATDKRLRTASYISGFYMDSTGTTNFAPSNLYYIFAFTRNHNTLGSKPTMGLVDTGGAVSKYEIGLNPRKFYQFYLEYTTYATTGQTMRSIVKPDPGTGKEFFDGIILLNPNYYRDIDEAMGHYNNSTTTSYFEMWQSMPATLRHIMEGVGAAECFISNIGKTCEKNVTGYTPFFYAMTKLRYEFFSNGKVVQGSCINEFKIIETNRPVNILSVQDW